MSTGFRGAQLVYGFDLGRPRDLYAPYGLVPHWLDDPDDLKDRAHQLLLDAAGVTITDTQDPGYEASRACGVELIEHGTTWDTQWLLIATYTAASVGETADITDLAVPDGADAALTRAIDLLQLPLTGRVPGWILTAWESD